MAHEQDGQRCFKSALKNTIMTVAEVKTPGHPLRSCTAQWPGLQKNFWVCCWSRCRDSSLGLNTLPLAWSESHAAYGRSCPGWTGSYPQVRGICPMSRVRWQYEMEIFKRGPCKQDLSLLYSHNNNNTFISKMKIIIVIFKLFRLYYYCNNICVVNCCS